MGDVCEVGANARLRLEHGRALRASGRFLQR